MGMGAQKEGIYKMRKATKITATWFGIAAGGASIEHGIFEILQGVARPDSRPAGLMIASMGPPCVPEKIWNSCEPAMTIIPNFLITGILAVIIGLAVLIWSIFFIQRKHGGTVLMLLSIAMLLLGGGIFPPLIGLIGGAAGIKINKPLTRKQPGSMLRVSAALWPWPLIIFLTWIIGQWIVGYFFNDFMQQAMYFGVVLIIVTLPLSVFAAYAHDVCAPDNRQ
jgi:hypothetical protein